MLATITVGMTTRELRDLAAVSMDVRLDHQFRVNREDVLLACVSAAVEDFRLRAASSLLVGELRRRHPATVPGQLVIAS